MYDVCINVGTLHVCLCATEMIFLSIKQGSKLHYLRLYLKKRQSIKMQSPKQGKSKVYQFCCRTRLTLFILIVLCVQEVVTHFI